MRYLYSLALMAQLVIVQTNPTDFQLVIGDKQGSDVIVRCPWPEGSGSYPTLKGCTLTSGYTLDDVMTAMEGIACDHANSLRPKHAKKFVCPTVKRRLP
jgi:hypothetical protein